MAYTPHQKIHPEVVSATAVGILDEELLLPNLITNASFDQEGYGIRDTVNIKVPGLLPSRSYALDNDRSQPLQFDQYTEKTVSVTFDRSEERRVGTECGARRAAAHGRREVAASAARATRAG